MENYDPVLLIYQIRYIIFYMIENSIPLQPIHCHTFFLILQTLIMDNFYGSIEISIFSSACHDSGEIYTFLINNNSKIRGIFFLAFLIHISQMKLSHQC